MEADTLTEGEMPPVPVAPDQPAPEQCVVSADGAMISLINTQWVEVRTLAIGEPKVETGTDGEAEIHVGQLSYVSRLCDALTFTHHAAGELRRRRVGEAKQVCSVTDGAEWCQNLMSLYRPDTLQILDFAHAAERLSQLLEALRHVGLHVPDRMLDRCLHVLKHRGPAALLRMANRFGSDLTQQKGIGQHLEYLRKRAALMQYPTFRAQGWPIGSGMVESANKLVVQARLKGAGMHWQRSHVNPMLALRLAVCNDRWQEMWHHAVRQQRIRIGHAPPQSAPTEPEDQVLPVDDRHAQVSPSPHAVAALMPHVLPSAPQRRSVTAPHAPVSASPMLMACFSRQDPGLLCSPSKKTPPQQADRCFCGAPLVRFKGHRPKEYCSDRCRQRAYRQRQALKRWEHRGSIVIG
ncbi:hypothetical protein [Dictyobacter aurantiacus]|uniref:Uncharacterized protein n=1 Tax=Dictyobacter aurantiacus TaxID=1936993 RepID=A0A401Z9J5_9CHLR|nr:hypothetical protein [Dictyobacter aurantiacus]GCE03512.1 hypothetical protein KDAU_08410 [Dictyobacter aurantiacus]